MITLAIFLGIVFYSLGFIGKIFNFREETFGNIVKWILLLLVGSWFAICAIY